MGGTWLPYKEKAVLQSQVLVLNWGLLEFNAPFLLCAPVNVQKVYFQAISRVFLIGFTEGIVVLRLPYFGRQEVLGGSRADH